MTPYRQLPFLFLWLIVPAIAVVGYPYFQFSADFMEFLDIGLTLYVLLIAVIVHAAAAFCGDMTAAKAGRLTLNPFPHVSIVGSVIVPLVLYFINPAAVLGWAKPVPFEPVQLKRYPRDQIFLVISGPFSNFVLSYIFFTGFLIAALVFNFLHPDKAIATVYEVGKEALNGLPHASAWYVLFKICFTGMLINIILGVLNLLPIPPLDGFWIFKAIMPQKTAAFLTRLQLFGFIILIAAIQLNLLKFLFYPIFMVMGAYDMIFIYCLG